MRFQIYTIKLLDNKKQEKWMFKIHKAFCLPAALGNDTIHFGRAFPFARVCMREHERSGVVAAAEILAQIGGASTKLGDLRKIAKQIKKDHDLAMELWSSGGFLARQLAVLIMDKKQLSQELIDKLDQDIRKHEADERNQIMDWLMANQLSKDKNTIALMESWANSHSSLQRRIYWYYQGRLRWVGQTPPPNSEALLSMIEERIESEEPEVQWAMNFTAAQIGIFQEEYRARCIRLGERTGLYKDEVVAKNCTPNYLPKYIAMQAAKLNK